MEQIGLEGIFDLEGFDAGIEAYNQAIAEMADTSGAASGAVSALEEAAALAAAALAEAGSGAEAAAGSTDTLSASYEAALDRALEMSRAAVDLAQQSQGMGDAIGGAADSLGNLGGAATTAAGGMGGLGGRANDAAGGMGNFGNRSREASSAAGGLNTGLVNLAAGLSAARNALSLVGGAINTVIGLFRSAAEAVNVFLNKTFEIGGAVDDFQDLTGASAAFGQQAYFAARIAGTSFDTVTNAVVQLTNRSHDAAEAAGGAMSSIGDKADETAERISRLNEDHVAKIADIWATQADRIAEINDRIAEAQVTLNERLAQLNADYQANLEESRAQLAERLAELEERHADRVAEINDRIAEEQQKYAERRADIERDLQDRIGEINSGLADDIKKAQESGLKAQAQLTEKYQSQIAAIEQKYASKRQSLQEKIYDPNTNPVLRAFYRDQLNRLDEQQSAEEDAAEQSYQNEQARLRAETELQVQELQRRAELERQAAEQRAAEQLARLAREHEGRLADLHESLTDENAEYEKQTAKLRAEQAKREADLKKSYDRAVAESQRAFDKQVEQAAKTQAKILAETEKRLAEEQKAYDRAMEDASKKIDEVLSGGGGGGGGGRDNPTAAALRQLGIDASTFFDLPFEEKFELLRNGLASIEDPAQRLAILSDIFGPRAAKELIDFFDVWDRAAEMGIPFTDEDLKLIDETQRGFNAVGLALDIIGAKIGAALLPVITPLLAAFQSFWETHGPAIISFLTNLGTQTIPAVGTALGQLGTWISTTLLPMFQPVVDAVTSAFGEIQKFFETHGKDIERVLTALWNQIKTGFEGALKIIASIINVIGAIISNDWGKLWEAVKKAVETILNAVIAFIGSVLNTILSIFNTSLEKVGQDVETAFNAVKTFIENTFNDIKINLETAWTNIQITFSNALASIEAGINTFINLAQAAWSNFTGQIEIAFNSLKTSIETTITDIGTAIETGINAAITFVQNLPQTLYQAGRDLVDGIVRGIQSMGNAVVNAVYNLLPPWAQDLWNKIFGAPARANSYTVNSAMSAAGKMAESYGMSVSDMNYGQRGFVGTSTDLVSLPNVSPIYGYGGGGDTNIEISITINGSASKKDVSDGVREGLFRAGYAVVD